MSEPDFWNDMERAQAILQTSKALKSKIDSLYENWVELSEKVY